MALRCQLMKDRKLLYDDLITKRVAMQQEANNTLAKDVIESLKVALASVS